ncbi:AAA ATPase family protein [Colletotrichum asianum]
MASASSPAPFSTPKPFPIIHLNGFPGTGKLTIAGVLQRQLGARCRLAGYQDLRRALRGAVFTSLVKSPASHRFVYIFTDFQSNDAVGSAVCAEYLAAARARGAALVSVVVRCDEATNLARLQGLDREAHHKIVDPELLLMFRRGAEIHHFDEPGCASLDMDVADLSAAEAARRILEHVLRICPELEDEIATLKAC